jgi:hypothetical protein
VHHREPRLIAERVIGPHFRDGDGVLDAEPASHFDGAGRHVQMEGRSHPAEVGPLRHRLEVVHGFAGLDFDDALEPVSLVLRGEHQIGEHLAGSDLHTGGLIVRNIDGDFVLPLQLRLQKPDDAIVFELLSDRPDQNRTQVASGEPVMLTHIYDSGIDLCQGP